MQNAGRALNWAYRSAIYVAQGKESGDSLVQEIQRREGNVGTHSAWVPGVGKVKDVNLGLCQDGSGTNKRSEAELDRGPR